MRPTQIVCLLAWLGAAIATPAPKKYNCALVGGALQCGAACLNSLKQCDTIMSATGSTKQADCFKTAISCAECCLTTTVTASSADDARQQCIANAQNCAANTFITCANQIGNCEYNQIASSECCGALGDIAITSCPPGTAINGCCSDAWGVIQEECHCGNTPNFLTSRTC
jgi:hypothetical protein